MTYLSHSGIKGMRWGIRRYQNEDGSLTEAGKQRYFSNEERKRKKQERKQPWREMSDSELRERTNRLNLENNYENALNRNRESSKSKVFTAGKKIATGIVAAAAMELAKEAFKGKLKDTVVNGSKWVHDAVEVLRSTGEVVTSIKD